MQPTNAPVPIKVGMNGDLMCYSHPAIPAPKAIVSQFCLPTTISSGMSMRPI